MITAFYETQANALKRARAKAKKTGQAVSVLGPFGGSYDLYTEAQLEDAFASGDLSEFEFNRDHVRTVGA